jgi:hypothetical protein
MSQPLSLMKNPLVMLSVSEASEKALDIHNSNPLRSHPLCRFRMTVGTLSADCAATKQPLFLLSRFPLSFGLHQQPEHFDRLLKRIGSESGFILKKVSACEKDGQLTDHITVNVVKK